MNKIFCIQSITPAHQRNSIVFIAREKHSLIRQTKPKTIQC